MKLKHRDYPKRKKTTLGTFVHHQDTTTTAIIVKVLVIALAGIVIKVQKKKTPPNPASCLSAVLSHTDGFMSLFLLILLQ